MLQRKRLHLRDLGIHQRQLLARLPLLGPSLVDVLRDSRGRAWEQPSQLLGHIEQPGQRQQHLRAGCNTSATPGPCCSRAALAASASLRATTKVSLRPSGEAAAASGEGKTYQTGMRVKRSRLQSQLAPSRRSWLVMKPPYLGSTARRSTAAEMVSGRVVATGRNSEPSPPATGYLRNGGKERRVPKDEDVSTSASMRSSAVLASKFFANSGRAELLTAKDRLGSAQERRSALLRTEMDYYTIIDSQGAGVLANQAKPHTFGATAQQVAAT
ncbi:hypothetical protein TSOC_005173 [Tetrabaena socialis]|uniref:Uncharacterized protein n=1 Tax=Tetrabaena socialis TaxID=47790 RepID=A0A2J8A700_9CHLO|nr:hypothetical protein TSOC_005173 [Tetrabaena socialis]|eukprot:PNH08299.1 hypothetical protein TSOC_005173 [Tetrabaena socialis]